MRFSLFLANKYVMEKAFLKAPQPLAVNALHPALHKESLLFTWLNCSIWELLEQVFVKLTFSTWNDCVKPRTKRYFPFVGTDSYFAEYVESM